MAENIGKIEELVREFQDMGYDPETIRNFIEAEKINDKNRTFLTIRANLCKKYKPLQKKVKIEYQELKLHSTLMSSFPQNYAFDDTCTVFQVPIEPFKRITDLYFLEDESEIDAGLSRHLEFIKAKFQVLHGIPSFSRVTEASERLIYVVGRVGFEEKNDIEQIFLEDSTGKIQLSLEEIEFYALFPGQIIMVEGTSDSLRFAVSKLYTATFDSIPPPLTSRQKVLIAVASGPFSTPDLNFSIFLNFIQQVQVNVLILIGPLVDCENAIVKSGNITIADLSIHDATYEEMFLALEGQIQQKCREKQCEVIIVPHIQEACHMYPLPLPSLKESFPTISDSPCNPALLLIDSIRIDIVPYDIVHEMISQTVIHSRTMTNKISTSLSNLFHQHSYLPVIPNSFPIEYSKFSHFCTRSPPNIFITTSKFPILTNAFPGVICVKSMSFNEPNNFGNYAVINISKSGSDFSQGIGVKYYKLS